MDFFLTHDITLHSIHTNNANRTSASPSGGGRKWHAPREPAAAAQERKPDLPWRHSCRFYLCLGPSDATAARMYEVERDGAGPGQGTWTCLWADSIPRPLAYCTVTWSAPTLALADCTTQTRSAASPTTCPKSSSLTKFANYNYKVIQKTPLCARSPNNLYLLEQYFVSITCYQIFKHGEYYSPITSVFNLS